MPAIPIRFSEFGFPHRFVVVDGVQKWVPFGMPEIPKKLEDCVFFLFAKTDTGLVGPLATGFIVARFDRRADGSQFHHTYAVTNAHTAPDGASVIRMTMIGGQTKTIDLEPHEWEFIPGGDDLAAADITDCFGKEDELHYRCLLEEVFVTEQLMSDALVGIGEDGFMLGLFADAPGRTSPGEERNAPVGRFGNLAAIASEDHPIEQANGQRRPSFIFDLRSRSGFSGSPVFIYRTIASDLTDFLTYSSSHDRLPQKTDKNRFLKLLGVHCGQYPELIEFKEQKFHKLKKEGDAEAVTLEDESKLMVPSSMTVVVPAWQVTNLLNTKRFEDQRRARAKRTSGEIGVRAVPEAVVVELETDNPSHKEDFTRLLGAAARSNKPAS